MPSSSQSRTCLAIILAAGDGTRMKSALPKVMHRLAGLPLLGHVLRAASESGAGRVAVVIGAGAVGVRTWLEDHAAGVAIHEQKERLGTANAVLAARSEFKRPTDDVLVLYGDTPLMSGRTLGKMRRALAKGADVVVLGFRAADPSGYGRLILDHDKLRAIREEKDATREERAITLCNAGVMAFTGEIGGSLLGKIRNDNAKGEYYLTDLVALANKAGKTVTALEVDANEVLGVNSRAELAEAEAAWQARARRHAMASGVTLVAPDTVFFSHDTELGRDVTVEPNVWFGPGVKIADKVAIHGFSHIEGATIATGVSVGPFARIRPGSVLAEGARIGNFVEVKNTTVGKGAKANHLTYLGDASIGAGTNIGAGTITCNYDGFGKYRTEIGAGVFIGSNSALVAPVSVGDGAYVAAGSTITKNVEAGALALARGRQASKSGWAAAFRARIKSERKPD